MQKTQILVAATSLAVLAVVVALVSGYGIHKPLTESSDVPLVNTYWKLMEIDGKPVEMTGEMEREPHFVLQGEENRMIGFSGCNRLSGTYTLEGNELNFAPGVAMTRMACPAGMDIEQAFTGVLNETTGWSISKDDLTLTDEDGNVLATFEQRLMR